jgi:hypothetical protein
MRIFGFSAASSVAPGKQSIAQASHNLQRILFNMHVSSSKKFIAIQPDPLVQGFVRSGVIDRKNDCVRHSRV